MSMGDYLRDYISRGDITLITECTPEAISRIELRSPGYIGLFTSVVIGELSDAQILHTVSQKTQQLGEAKGTLIEENAIQEILRLQKWFTPYSELPGKTIHFLHALISDKERSELKIIDKSSIHKRFSQETGMPEFMINPDTALDVEVMNTFFQQNIYGQLEAIETVTDLLISVKVAVIRRGKPLASLLFVGPTGVGKTEMAKVLAEFMFGNRNKMIRFDMSEYADLQGIMRLTGDSGGEGLLTAAVRQAPFSVLLFDELEKVHPAFYDLLLQILGEGRLTDARGRVADFCSTIIIMTSNIGARSFQSGSIGFGDSANTSAGAAEHFKTQVQNYFRPELFNRLDRIIAFAPLDQEIVRKIIDREISLIRKREGIKNRNLSLDIHKEVLDYLGKVGYDARYGARFLQRTLQEQLVIPLSKHLNTYYFDNPLSIKITLKDTVIEFEIEILEKIDPLHQDISEEGNLTLIGFERIITQARREANTIEL
jgi:ATP-dependent Clp protease ATP-binding subunit ClpA